MGKIYFGLMLTLLVSLLVMLAGGLFARRTLTEVDGVDREVFEEFVDRFGDMVEEEETKREVLLANLADEVGQWRERDEGDFRERLEQVAAIRGALFFVNGRKSKEWIVLGEIGSRSPAEVVEEGKKIPLLPERAVVIPETFFDELIFGMRGRIDNEEQTFHVRWYSPLQNEVICLLVENAVAKADLLDRIKTKAASAFEMALRSGESITLEYRDTVLLSADAIPQDRPSSREVELGGFSVRAWSRMRERSFVHWPTLWSSVGLGGLIGMVGFGLFCSQRKMWRESEERVSFVNRVSHELGTPLTNMTLNLELASRSLRTQPELAGRRLEKVREEVSRLGRLVTNVLWHSRNGKNERNISRGPCEVNAVIEGVVEQFRPALERRKVVIDWQPGKLEELEVDADALSQIVWNLISNVEKYAAGGGWMGVRTKRDQSGLVVEVSDRGEGISGEKRLAIFKAFERVHDSIREGVSGTGLGLSISRELAEAMGGKLELIDKSELTTFRLTIPILKR